MTAEYPPGSVRALLDTDLVTEPTRAALLARLSEAPQEAPRCLDARTFATLKAACDRLIPQQHRAAPVDLAGQLDRRLAADTGDGWRYDALPPDGEAYRQGLTGFDEEALACYGAPFVALDAAQQDAVLAAVQRGAVQGGAWATLPAQRFFEELLADLVQLYYSHPLAQEEIGYVGMADARGWSALGLGRLEAWEPRPRGGDHG